MEIIRALSSVTYKKDKTIEEVIPDAIQKMEISAELKVKLNTRTRK